MPKSLQRANAEKVGNPDQTRGVRDSHHSGLPRSQDMPKRRGGVCAQAAAVRQRQEGKQFSCVVQRRLNVRNSRTLVYEVILERKSWNSALFDCKPGILQMHSWNAFPRATRPVQPAEVLTEHQSAHSTKPSEVLLMPAQQAKAAAQKAQASAKKETEKRAAEAKRAAERKVGLACLAGTKVLYPVYQMPCLLLQTFPMRHSMIRTCVPLASGCAAWAGMAAHVPSRTPAEISLGVISGGGGKAGCVQSQEQRQQGAALRCAIAGNHQRQRCAYCRNQTGALETVDKQHLNLLVLPEGRPAWLFSQHCAPQIWP